MPLQFELCPGRPVGGDQPCFIIAEIGQNHQGDLEIAKQMIRVAKECGADCAKFQKSELEHKFNKKALARPYTSKHSWGKSYGDHKHHLEFSHDQYRELQRYAKEIGIFFTASGMDEVWRQELQKELTKRCLHFGSFTPGLNMEDDEEEGHLNEINKFQRDFSGLVMAVEFLHELDVPFFKVGSGDTNNFPYLEKTAKKGRPMVISSGMQSMSTMQQVYRLVKPLNPNFCFLQCTSAYPLQPEDVNLRVIKEYQSVFPDIPIGYSGHETGIAISIAAVAMGAKVLERHITLDKTWKGSDHQASLEPKELAELVRSIRLVEKAMGSPVKQLLPCEVACNEKLGKSVVAKVRIPEGTTLTLDMLTVKVAEPKGCHPEDIFELVGKKVKINIEEDETLVEDAIENHGEKVKG